MASRKKPAGNGIPEKCHVQRDGSAISVVLPVNPDFADPNEIDRQRGVEPDAFEAPLSERAIAARSMQEILPTNWRNWIAGERSKRGDRHGATAELADDILQAQPTRMAPESPGGRRVRYNLKRALERSAPELKPGRTEEHAGVKKPEYRSMIAHYILAKSQVSLGVYGYWRVVNAKGKAYFTYAWVRTHTDDLEEVEAARRILADGGAGHIVHCVAVALEILGDSGEVDLERLFGLQVELDRAEVSRKIFG